MMSSVSVVEEVADVKGANQSVESLVVWGLGGTEAVAI